MTWSPQTSHGNEQDKIAAVALRYLRGRTLDLGCGTRKVWPFVIGVDNGGTFGAHTAADVRANIDDLSLFADACCDAVFSSHALEDFPRERVPDILREWARVLKVGGHLVLYVPSANLYPKVGEPGANPAHRWDIYPGDIEAILREHAEDWASQYGWELLESEERGERDEYSLFIVARKTEHGWTENVWQRNPAGKQRALVCRFGAIGDQIWAASVLPGLREQGYHISYLTTPDAADVLKHDPHVDEWLTQEKDACPNHELGPFWEQLTQRYDRFINLSESVEGSLLTLPGRLQHAYSDAARQRIFGSVNYLERTTEIAGVTPNPKAARFYASADELRWAHALKRAWGEPTIVWAINGSSPHKVYPWTQVVVKWLLDRTPARVVLLSDPGRIGRELQDALCTNLREAGADMTRVKPMGAGAWTVRQALTFCQVADCVVGPETGPLNAVAMAPMPKVIYLSHSSEENLTRDWVNATTLIPAADRAPCFPCHRLHYTWEHCHQDEETHAALCASAIAPADVFRAIAMALGAQKVAA